MSKQPQPEVVARLRAGVERLLETQTYAEIPIDALVKEGGLAKSTFYVYFADKDELLRILAAGVMQDLVDYEGAWWTLPPDASKEEVGAALERMFEAYAEHGALMAAIVDAALYDNRMREQFAALLDGAIAATADHLRGRVDDPKRVAFWLVWMLERGFSLLLPGVTGAQRTRRLQAMTDVIWAASWRP